jgi:hypothetical protein
VRCRAGCAWRRSRGAGLPHNPPHLTLPPAAGPQSLHGPLLARALRVGPAAADLSQLDLQLRAAAFIE